MFKKFSSVMLILVFAFSLSISSCGKTSDIDIMLDQYEKMMVKYMPLMEKAAKGDGKVDEELAKMTKEMEEWSEKWEGKLEELSEEDMAKVQKRMMEIAQKMYKK